MQNYITNTVVTFGSYKTATVHVEGMEIPVIVYQGQRVITTELLAQVYGTESSNIHDNHRKNPLRFEKGKHFFKLEGEELRDLKKSLTGIFPVSGNLRHLTLWTERGAARHAKMLDTDQAWSVFDKLESAYFEAKDAPVLPASEPKVLPDPPAPTALGRFFQAWHRRFGSSEVLAAELLALYQETLPGHGARPFQEAVDALAQPQYWNRASRLGAWLGKQAWRDVDGYRLEKRRGRADNGMSNHWRVIKLSGGAAFPASESRPLALPPDMLPPEVHAAVIRAAHAATLANFDRLRDRLEQRCREQLERNTPAQVIEQMERIGHPGAELFVLDGAALDAITEALKVAKMGFGAVMNGLAAVDLTGHVWKVPGVGHA
jgi:hypothetical protein